MVIYVRIASRELTPQELVVERLRLADMAQRVEVLRRDKIQKDMEQQRMPNVVEGVGRANPISLSSP
jgi:hypothetical protein